MAQRGLNSETRRRGAHRDTCKAIGLVNGQIPRTALVNGLVVHHGCSAAATRTRETTAVGALRAPKQSFMINGYLYHGNKDKITKAALPKKLRTQGSSLSVVTNSSVTGKVQSAGAAVGVLTSDGTRMNPAELPGGFDQVVPDPNLSASNRKQRRVKKFRHKKKRENEITSQGSPATALVPPQEKEDWENEIQEVTIKDWEKHCFGQEPYGPEDMLPFALRDLTLQRGDTVVLPLTARYNPAKHHPRPFPWFHYGIPTEPEQFADADE